MKESQKCSERMWNSLKEPESSCISASEEEAVTSEENGNGLL